MPELCPLGRTCDYRHGDVVQALRGHTMATLFLREADVERLLDMPLAIEVVEEAFRHLADGSAANVPRVRARGSGMILHTMSATADYLNLAGWKCYSTTRVAALFHLGLYDATTGKLRALIEADRLGQLRTGAVTAVAVKYMTGPEVSELGLFGAGTQARTQLEAVASVRPLRRAYVYSRDQTRRETFANEMSARLSIEVAPVERPRDAAANLPLVITATNSVKPVLEGEWLNEGATVCAIGSNWLHRAEIDAQVVRRAETIVCDSIQACQAEAGDFNDAIAQGFFDWSKVTELADIVIGRANSSANQSGLSLFKSVGLAIEDVAIGGKLLELAEEEGGGTTLPF